MTYVVPDTEPVLTIDGLAALVRQCPEFGRPGEFAFYEVERVAARQRPRHHHRRDVPLRRRRSVMGKPRKHTSVRDMSEPVKGKRREATVQAAAYYGGIAGDGHTRRSGASR